MPHCVVVLLLYMYILIPFKVHHTCIWLFIRMFFYYSKNVLFCSAANGKMMRKVPCEVCGYVMRIIKDPRDLLSTNLQVCSQCGEANVSFTSLKFCLVIVHAWPLRVVHLKQENERD